MKQIPKEESVEWKKVKSNKGVLTYVADVSFVEGGDTVKVSMNDTYPLEPHPDLTDALLRLKRPLAVMHGLIDLEILVDSKDFGATADQLEIASNHTVEKLEKIKVTGVALSGKDKNRGVVITGTYDGQAINSRNIKYSGTKFGFEADLEDIVDSICDETYAFVFKGKRAQQEMFGGSAIDGTGDDFEAQFPDQETEDASEKDGEKV